MANEVHFNWHMIEKFFLKVHDFFHIKLLIGLFSTGLCYAFDCNFAILWTMLALVLIDTVTGLAYAVKIGEVRSRGFYRVAVKLTMYFIMILVAKLVDKNIPLDFASSMLKSFLVITEAISIFENIGRLGFPVPTSLLSKLGEFKDKK